jgi:hypothetical protein
MAYALSYKAPTGKATLYAIIQDLESGLYWDKVAKVWVSAVTTNCRHTLTEGSDKGFYTVSSADLTPGKGGMYKLFVYNSADTDYLITTTEIYPPKSKTVLEVINAIQTDMRMPLSAALTDSLAKIILSKMNTVLTVLLPQNNILDHLKVVGSFTIKSNRNLWRLCPVNVDAVDAILTLNKADEVPVERLSDEDFKAIADGYTRLATYNQPLYYRIAQRDYGYPILEIAPAPDQAYTLYYEILKAPKELTAVTDYVPRPDVIKPGALMLVKQELGRDASVEQGIFGAAMERASTVESNTSFCDAEV